MTNRSTITRTDYEDYLIYLYFGARQNFLRACIKRAYRDFSRTLHNLSDLEGKEDVKRKAGELLETSLIHLKSFSDSSFTIINFDDWHKGTCYKIISLFNERDFQFFVGQAQKWINMSMKYVFTLGEQRIQGFEFVYPFCHIPFDNIIIEKLAQKYKDFPSFSCSWSRLDNYDEYLQRQSWLRQKFHLAPLDIEFRLWLGQEINE